MLRPMTTTASDEACTYCGAFHKGVCRRIRALYYNDKGDIARIEFHEWAYLPATARSAVLPVPSS